MQTGCSSRSRHDREHQLKRTQAASMQQQLKRATIGEQQLEADTNGEQQFKRMQSGQGAAADSKRMQSGRAALHRELSGAGLLTVGEQGGSS